MELHAVKVFHEAASSLAVGVGVGPWCTPKKANAPQTTGASIHSDDFCLALELSFLLHPPDLFYSASTASDSGGAGAVSACSF